MFVATAIPIGARRVPGQLYLLSLKCMKDSLRKQLVRAKLSHIAAIGAIDFTFNEHSYDRWPAHWQPHFHLAVEGCTGEQWKHALARYFPADAACSKPIQTAPIKDPMEQLSYLMKAYFVRRVSYVDDQRRLNTRITGLKRDQLVEVSTFIASFKVTDRIFMRNVRLQGYQLRQLPVRPTPVLASSPAKTYQFYQE